MTTNITELANLRGLALEWIERELDIDDLTYQGGSTSINKLMRSYINAANPANIITLLDALEAAQAESELQAKAYGLAIVERDAALARLAEIEAGASLEPSALQAANEELITALAACRDAFPVPDAGSRLDDWFCSAMADPLEVPDYVKACVGASPVQPPYTYASTQATTCAGCGEHKHTPLRIDAMDGYVCLTCIDKKLGTLLGEFGYPDPEPSQDVDPNAPWLSDAHMLCADQGIPPGHITDRIRALRDKLEQPSQAGDAGCLICANGNDIPDGEWCRACGFSRESNLGRAVRLARGGNQPPTTALKFAAINAKESK